MAVICNISAVKLTALNFILFILCLNTIIDRIFPKTPPIKDNMWRVLSLILQPFFTAFNLSKEQIKKDNPLMTI